MNYFFEYVRLVSYVTILASSLAAYRYKKYSLFLLLGDALFSIFTICGLIHITMFGGNRIFVNNAYVTPGVVLWAIFHFSNLLKYGGN